MAVWGPLGCCYHSRWYDLQGCGKCNDYCRWVKGTGSGGDPSARTVDADKGSYWSCRLAGGDEAYTAEGTYKTWSHKKCDHEGSETPAPPSAM